ncbi:DenB-like DNA endonuclease IV [Pectobacterium bacteriophage PM2]|uniref:Endonuclease IV n=1 Tax=Pectobacterium bacteriophage PM2 TaxID=1429794 RepID=A0A0A0Q0T3_9CAUD|nr:DenB-like DNA endonuclease IV [Pectobacterium bacteriophage PM2]AHY25251.1 endonuclease IV [Pectobacterium bacteriophage PM2]
MITSSDTWALLKSLKPLIMSHSDLNDVFKAKARSTTRYSLGLDESQDSRNAMRRNSIAMLAEQLVAEKVFGYAPTGNENTDNPYSFAFDIVAKDGVRIEVKTHQAKSKWISVNTGNRGAYPATYPGINLGPFLDHRLADVIIIFDTKEVAPGSFLFTPKIIAGPQAFRTDSGLVQKSQYNDGYYIRTCNPENWPFYQFTKQI